MMTDTHTGHLIKMINEIARNLAVGGDDTQAAGRVANHLQRFWTRDMQRDLQAHVAAGGSGLLPVAALALDSLQKESET